MPPTVELDEAERPKLEEVLEAFRAAAVSSARRVAADLRELPVRTGSEPVYGIEGLDVSLNVGVQCTSDDVFLDFDAAADRRSTIAFRVQVPPVPSLQQPAITVTPLYDERAISGLFQYVAVVTDSDGNPVPSAKLDLRARRADRPGGQVRVAHLLSDVNGSVRFDVDSADRKIVFYNQTETELGLPARSAAAWDVWLESRTPAAASAYIRAPRRERERT